MLYTRKGDKGDTGLFGCDQRISKSSTIAEALGVLDEANSFLGLCKVKAQKEKFIFDNLEISGAVYSVQNNLFIIQSQIAGSDKKISNDCVVEMEKLIDKFEKQLPPINKFVVSGGTELSAMFDYARTLARRAERRVVAVYEEGLTKTDENTLKYLNRLSSFLYVLARLANTSEGVKESSPEY